MDDLRFEVRCRTFPLIVLLLFAGGCATIVREQVNRKLPPVALEQRALASIRTNQDYLDSLPQPDGGLFVSADFVRSYIRQVLSHPLPLPDEALAPFDAPPTVKAASVDLVPQAVRATVDLTASLKEKIDIDMQVTILISPEVKRVAEGQPALLILRIAETDAYVRRIDLSRSSYRWIDQIFGERAVASLLSQALTVFRDNLNGTLTDVLMPLDLATLRIAEQSPKEPCPDTPTDPRLLRCLHAMLEAGSALVTPEGIWVMARAALVDSRKLGTEPLPPPSEPLPTKPAPEELEREYQRFARAFGAIRSTAFPDLDRAAAAVDIMKSTVSRELNANLADLSLEISGSYPIEKREPDKPEDKQVRVPKMKLHCDELRHMDCSRTDRCTTFFQGKADKKAQQAGNDCRDARSKIKELEDKLDDACKERCETIWGVKVCEPVSKFLCDTTNGHLRAARETFSACSDTLDMIKRFREAGEEGPRKFADQLGLGDYYRQVCAYYNAVLAGPECEAFKLIAGSFCNGIQTTLNDHEGKMLAELDWEFEGDGDHALKASGRIRDFRLRDDLSGASAEVRGEASARVKGEAVFKVAPLLQGICPTRPEGQRLVLPVPITIEAKLEEQKVRGDLRIDTGRDAKLTFDPEPVSFKLFFPTHPFRRLLEVNNVNLPCTLNGWTWAHYQLIHLITLPNYKFEVQQKQDLGETALSNLEDETELPVAWTLDPDTGETRPSEFLTVPVQYADLGLRFGVGLNAPPDSSLPTSEAVGSGRRLLLSAGLGVGALAGTPSDRDRFTERGNGLTWFNPYLSLGRESGPAFLLSTGHGPGLRKPGLIAAVAYQPVRSFPLRVYAGARLPKISLSDVDEADPAVGVAIDLGSLCLLGCEGIAAGR